MNTTYWLNVQQGNIYGTQTTPALPTEYKLGWSSTTPTIGGTNVTEPSGNGYARITLSNLSTPTNGLITNTSNNYFPISTGSQGTATHYVVYGNTTGNNLLMFGALTTSQAVSVDSIVTILAGEIKFQLANPA